MVRKIRLCIILFLFGIFTSGFVTAMPFPARLKPSDGELRDIFSKNEPIFVKLKEMLTSDKQLLSVGETTINSSFVEKNNFAELLHKAGIDAERYQYYISLLDSINCFNLSYMTTVGGSPGVYNNKNEMWYLAWNLQKMQYKCFVYTIDGSQPAGSLLVKDTDDALAKISTQPILVVSQLEPHWFIAQFALRSRKNDEKLDQW